MRSTRGNRNNHSGFDFGSGGCPVWLFIGLVAMPIIGLFLIGNKKADSTTKALGWVLFVVGMLIWVCMEIRHY